MARRTKLLRVSAYNGDFRLADRMYGSVGGKEKAEFPTTKQGRRDACAWILDFMRRYAPEANHSNPAKIAIEEVWPSGDWFVEGKATGKAGAWVWEKRPEWMPP